MAITRRELIRVAPLVLLAPAVAAAPSVAEQLMHIRDRIGGRLGVHVLDTGSGRRCGLDADSRYAMASTFKLMLAAAVLRQVDAGKLELTRPVRLSKGDLVTYSPVVEQFVAQGSLSVRELCAAVVEISDNTAANLLLPLIGGPPGYTRFMRRLGDRQTRLDRIELELNTNLPGDVRDTTTPRAMVDSMQKVLIGGVLSPTSRALLIEWLVASTRGLQRIRAGVPAGWRAGDKTGTGANGAINDLAILWPPQRPPLLVAVYTSESNKDVATISAAHAEIGKLVAAGWG